MEDKVL